MGAAPDLPAPTQDLAPGPAQVALDRALARVAVALRVGSTVVGSLVAVLGTATPDVPASLVVLIAALMAWSVIFAVVTLRDGMRSLLMMLDALVVALICMHSGALLPADLPVGSQESGWVIMVASTGVYLAQIGLRPQYGLPIAVVLACCYWLGTVTTSLIPVVLVLQGIMAACIVELLRRAGRAADRAVAHQVGAYIDAAVQAAVRADELDQQRRLHDTVLATMTVVGTGAIPNASATLQARAAADVAVVDRLLAGTRLDAATSSATARLDLALRAVSLTPRPGLPTLRTVLEVPPITLPQPIVAGIGECVAEALTNVAKHSGTTSAVVQAYHENSSVVIEVNDDGLGADTGGVSLHRRGLRGSITGRMQALGGDASIVSQLGKGTRVTLRWPNG